MRRGTIQQQRSAETGFTLIELLVVISLILIMASFAAPIYSRIVTRSHEAVLKDDLFTLREMINRYTLDNHKPPESLQALVKAGYFSGGLPIDPFTGSNKTWQPVIEQVQISPEKTFTGVVNVHSGSNARSLEGTPYSSW
ncbi:MAG: prepilin-type N-terminal cleavage/methylation domain-containing protein [Acidobacteriota bacterium]